MTRTQKDDWTRNGARFVCAAMVLLASVGGLGASNGRVPSGAPVDLSVRAGVDLNRASSAELALLPGIGPALSESIVQDRAENGPYFSVDDLTRVKGIGERRVMAIAPHGVVDH